MGPARLVPRALSSPRMLRDLRIHGSRSANTTIFACQAAVAAVNTEAHDPPASAPSPFPAGALRNVFRVPPDGARRTRTDHGGPRGPRAREPGSRSLRGARTGRSRAGPGHPPPHTTAHRRSTTGKTAAPPRHRRGRDRAAGAFLLSRTPAGRPWTDASVNTSATSAPSETSVTPWTTARARRTAAASGGCTRRTAGGASAPSGAARPPPARP